MRGVRRGAQDAERPGVRYDAQRRNEDVLSARSGWKPNLRSRDA